MRVKTLIKKLKNQPENYEVVITGLYGSEDSGDWYIKKEKSKKIVYIKTDLMSG